MSIPARAGEPPLPDPCFDARAVYPRACGGTPGPVYGWYPPLGLSPRVRGNHTRGIDGKTCGRSIPARAGEPAVSATEVISLSVYPRACGGTYKNAPIPILAMGLSPRVRGNRSGSNGIHRHSRSIPARAGEPERRGCSVHHREVYPRACGGTELSVLRLAEVLGLSPRVRGNRQEQRSTLPSLRSIPARAGEPTRASQETCASTVYPRACGGTGPTIADIFLVTGLSPRVRGNLPGQPLEESYTRSIPARAGEPPSGSTSKKSQAVYPRACGGTHGRMGCCCLGWGLSPRVRGNLVPCAGAGAA